MAATPVTNKCACSKSFTIDHALNCLTGGFPIVQHNEIEVLTADLMLEVCHDVCVPTFQSLTGFPMPPLTGKTQLA